MDNTKLSHADRRFFGLIADATFTNPFSEKREAIDSEIVGMTGQKPWSEVISLLIERLEGRLAQMDKAADDSTTRLEHFADDGDKELMKHAFLFSIFHQAARDFDALIRKQERAADKTLTVTFAPKTLEQLTRRGFTPHQAARYFALFYQIRRAYYFIQQGLVGQSLCMRKLRMDLWNNIFTYDIRGYEQYLWDRMEDFATLLEGPTGCGKGAAAAAVGKSCFIPFDSGSNTFQSSFMDLFVPANLSQYASTLLESELFGHTRGAFTGAVSEHEGLFGLCRPHGTIFLDEIGEISTQVQVKLLKVLEERTYTPVGSHKTKHFYGRVIAATNRPVAQLRRDGAFREDFYYRLCADCIDVPSLAQRIEQNPQELAELVEHFTRQITTDYNPQLCEKVLNVIQTRLPKGYAWPGNVRELAQCIRRVILKDDYQPAQTAARTRAEQIKDALEKGTLSADALVSEYCKLLYDKHPSYQDVARIAGLDWRTAKKFVTAGE